GRRRRTCTSTATGCCAGSAATPPASSSATPSPPSQTTATSPRAPCSRPTTAPATAATTSLPRVRRALLALIVAATVVAIPVASAQAANPWIQKKRPLNIAHQGGEDEFPSNTMYAFRKALKAGADMLELDIGVTKDNKVIVMHDATVDGKTNGHGTVSSKTFRQMKKLDAAYWFAPRASEHYSHDLSRRAYRFRGVATGKRKPPKGFTAKDFRVPTL